MAINFSRTRTSYKFISTEILHKITKTPRLNVHLYDLARNMLKKTYMHENDIIKKFGSFPRDLIAKSIHKPPHSILLGNDSKLLSL